MLGFLSDEDTVETGWEEDDSNIVIASIEAKVHRAILINTPAPAVKHTHPKNAVAISFKYNEIIPIDVEGSYYLRKIPVVEFEYGTGFKEMEEVLPKYSEKYPGVIRGHGAFAIGKSVEEALHYSHMVEDISEIL